MVLVRWVDLSGATIRGAALANVDVSGEIEPERVKMRPQDAAGFREA